MPDVERDFYDVVVLGSGFSGSLLATILAKQGQRVALIDRATHPRFSIGESSTPAAGMILQSLIDRYGLDELQPLTHFGTWQDQVPEVMCGCKRGFSYIWHGDSQGYQGRRDHRDELLFQASRSRERADTQWYRPELDEYLVKYARRCGVAVKEATQVDSITKAASGCWSLHLREEGQPSRIETEFLVDASGQGGVLLNHLGIKDISDRLLTRTSALYGHWDQVPHAEKWLIDQGAATQDYPYSIDDAAVHHLFHDGWLWQLRFESGRTSVGFVFDESQQMKPASTLPYHASSPLAESASAGESGWSQLLARHPVLSELLAGSSLAPFPGSVFFTGPLQRLKAVAAGEDWVALPSTVGVIDPLHSTGIAHSLSAVERISDILVSKSKAKRHQRLSEYSTELIQEFEMIDQLVSGCYVGLQDFKLFAAWSMVYFAVATTYERYRETHRSEVPSFFLADHGHVGETVRRLSDELQLLVERSRLISPQEINRFCQRIESQIQPLNHVGLFAPPQPNLYYEDGSEQRSQTGTGFVVE